MGCEQYQAQFTDFLEATLPETEWRELESHLRQCPTCAADIKRFRQTVGALHGLEVVEPPRHLSRALSTRIAELAQVTVEAPAPVRVQVRPAFSWRLAGSLAGACLALAVIVFVGVHGMRTPTEIPVASPAAVAPAAPEAAEVPATSGGPADLSAPATETPTPEAAPASAPRREATPAPASRPARATPLAVSQAAAPARQSPAPGASEAASTPPPSPATPPIEKSTTPQRTEAGGPVAFGAAGGGAVTPRAVGVDISVDPPGSRVVNSWGTIGISNVPEGDVPRARVRVIGGEGLEVRGGNPAYLGSLSGGQSRRLSAEIRARRAGDLSLRVVVTSDTPVVNTDLAVRIPGYRAAVLSGQTQRQFRSVPLAEAARQIAADGGLKVTVAPALAGRRNTADFSRGVSASSALRLLAQMADGRLEHSDGEYHLVR